MKITGNFQLYLDAIDKCTILESGELYELEQKYVDNKNVVLFPFGVINYDTPFYLFANNKRVKVGGKKELENMMQQLESACETTYFEIVPANYIFTAVEFDFEITDDDINC